MSKLESVVQMHNGKNKDSTSEKYSAPALSKGLDILECLSKVLGNEYQILLLINFK